MRQGSYGLIEGVREPFVAPSRRNILDLLENNLIDRSGLEVVSVILVNLDGFRMINDIYGERGGDELLSQVWDRVKLSSDRVRAQAGWLGADEYLVVLREETHEGGHALQLAAAIERSLEQAPFSVLGRSVRLTASIGLATSARQGASARDLMLWANRAMTRAKTAPAALQVFTSDGSTGAFVSDPELAQELNTSLQDPQGAGLFVVYQPIFDLASSRIAGLEALVRWQHPTRGTLAPGDFFPTALTSRICNKLDRWVVNRALSDFMQLDSLGMAPGFLSVNVTGGDLAFEDFTDDILAKVQEYAIAPHRLVVELTEADLSMEYIGEIAESLWELRDAGVRVALDDFGTGTSSVSHLDSFPADVLKIDKSMVLGVGDNQARIDLIRGVVYLAKSIGLEVVAEGVDSDFIAGHLSSFGCKLGQGFFLARPGKVSEVADLIRSVGISG